MNVLILSQLNFANAQTVVDHVLAFSEFSRHSIFTVPWMGPIPRELDFDRFDVLVFHYSSAPYNTDFLTKADRDRVKAFRGLKVSFRQDEYQEIDRYHQVLNDLEVDLFYTCIPEEFIEKVYPTERLPKLVKKNTLTGFVPRSLLDYPRGPLKFRRVDVGYRSRKLPYWYGDLAYEKTLIADMFDQACAEDGLSSDISICETDRLYGQDWADFLGRCKCILGTESGASVLDFTGEIEKHWNDLTGGELGSEGIEFSYEDYRREHLADRHNGIRMHQISPRVFDAAAMGTALVLFEGQYSGILEPGQHFISVKKDGSNLEEVCSAIRDTKGLQEMADRAYQEVASNPSWGYEHFVHNSFDADIESLSQSKRKTTKPFTQGDFSACMAKNGYVDVGDWIKREQNRDPRVRRPYNLALLPEKFGKNLQPSSTKAANLSAPNVITRRKSINPGPLQLHPLTIEVTNRCNMKCIMCVSHGAMWYQGQSDNMPKFIDDEFFKDVVLQYKALAQDGPKAVLPQFQGEPLLHPRFFELCKFIDSQGLNFSFTTNGSLLKPELSRELVKLKHLSHIAFSFDGASKESYEAIRVNADYEKVTSNIHSFLEAKGDKPIRTSISCTEQPINEPEIIEMYRQWTPLVDEMTVNHLAIDGRPQRLNWVPNRIPCGDLWHFMVILTDGKVVPCCRDYLYKFDLGNIKDSSLETIWRGEQYNRLRRLHMEGKWNDIPICNDCDTWMCRTPRRDEELVNNRSILVTKGPFFKSAERVATEADLVWQDWNWKDPACWYSAAADVSIKSFNESIHIQTNGDGISYQGWCDIPELKKGRKYICAGRVTFKGDNTIRLGVLTADGSRFLLVQDIKGTGTTEFSHVFEADKDSDGGSLYINNNGTPSQLVAIRDLGIAEMPKGINRNMAVFTTPRKNASQLDSDCPTLPVLPNKKRYKVLFLCNFQRHEAQTIIDHCKGFGRYSRHEYFYANPVNRPVPTWLDFSDFDIIIIHYSIYTISESYLDRSWISGISQAPGLTVMFIQDEYRRVNEFTEMMRRLRVNVLFTCVPEPEIDKVYPESALPGVIKINNLTGYVPESANHSEPDFDAPRSIDVGYRGRALGYWYGQLAQDKAVIACEFLKYTQGMGLACDISYLEEDRIYGKDWPKFLHSCRCTLGTESGASVFDFTGEIEDNVREYVHENPDATFEQVRELFFKDQEGLIRLNQISPRMFESIAAGVCLVLFEGEYSGILKPDRHFISLKRDFSNIYDVIRKIKDHEYTREMARRAYDDIIGSRDHTYESFVSAFDDSLEQIALGSVSLEDEDIQDAPPAERQSSRFSWLLCPPYILAWICKFWFKLSYRCIREMSLARVVSRARDIAGFVRRGNASAGKALPLKHWEFYNPDRWQFVADGASLEQEGQALKFQTNGKGIEYQACSKITGIDPQTLYKVKVSVRFHQKLNSIRLGVLSKDEGYFLKLTNISAHQAESKTADFTFFSAGNNACTIVISNNDVGPREMTIEDISIVRSRLRERLAAIFYDSMLMHVGRTDNPFFIRHLLKLLWHRFSRKRKV